MLDTQAGTDQTGQIQSTAMDAWKKLLGGAGGMGDALQNYIRQAQGLVGENFSENILPALNASAVAGGNLGGTRGAVAAGIAGRDAGRAGERIATTMTGDAYQQDQNRIMQALGMSGGLASLSGASWAPLLNYAQLLGKPTVLGQSESSGSSSGWNIAGSMTGRG
jgi:hypothetical protein